MSTKILYIEDNPDNQKLVFRLLSVHGFDVHLADSGPDGLEFVKTNTPDLILMDISMPQMDGYTVTKIMRNSSHLDHVPIIALTANVMKGDREKTIEAGCNGYIQKPIDIDTFPDQVQQFIDL